MAAAKIRSGRVRKRETNPLLVREVFQLGRELADPTAVVEPADEAAVALVSCHVQELLLGYQRPKAGEVRIRVVAHDPAHDSRELAPLALRERLAVTGDGDQQGGRRPGDRLGQKLF